MTALVMTALVMTTLVMTALVMTPVPRGDVRRRNRDDAGGRVGGRQEADVAGGVRGAGLQELLLPAAHRDLQAPPGGEGGEVQQEQLGAAARVPGSNQRGDGAGGGV